MEPRKSARDRIGPVGLGNGPCGATYKGPCGATYKGLCGAAYKGLCGTTYTALSAALWSLNRKKMPPAPEGERHVEGNRTDF